MKRKFRTSNGKIYEIDESQVNSFMKAFPDAVEVSEYNAAGKLYNISNDQLPNFMKAFPDAFPEKKKESTDTTTGEETVPQGTASQSILTPSQKRVESSEKKSRVNSSIEELYQIQKDMSSLIVESRNPSPQMGSVAFDQPMAAKKAEINRLYNRSQEVIKELKTQAGKSAEYYYPGIEQAINNLKSKADQADAQNWDPAYTKAQIEGDAVWLKNGLHEVEKASGKPGLMSKERANIDLAKHTENVKKAQAEINKMGTMGRKDGWSKQEMEKYMAPALQMIQQEADALSKKLPENQRYIASGMVDSAKALVQTYVSSVGAWTDKQTEEYTSGHNQWAARTVSEIEDAYNITSGQRKQAGGVPEEELDAYVMNRGFEFDNLDVNLIKEVNKPSDPSQATILSPGQGQAKKIIMDAAVSDYFTYMDKVNPSMAKTWRQKYDYIKNQKDERSAGDEEFLLEFETKAMRLAMAALDRKIKDTQFELSADSDFEKSLNLDKYRRSMMQLEDEKKNIESEYKKREKKAKELNTQFEAETKATSKKIKNLQNLLQAGMISQDDYLMAVAPMSSELDRKQKEFQANFPEFEDLEQRQKDLKDKVAQIQDETGVNDAAIEKLQKMGDKYSQYGADYERMNALVGVNGQIGTFYHAFKERERENQRAAEFRVKGMDSELGREIEDQPWYKEYLAKGLHYTWGQAWGSEAVRGFSGMVGSSVLGLMEIPAVAASLAGSDDYGWTDKLMDFTIDLKKSAGREGSFGDVEKYGYEMWMPGKIANMGGSVAASLLMYMTPGTYLKTGSKLAQAGTQWATSFLLSQGDMFEYNLEVAKKNNKSEQWAAAVTQGEAAVLATIELAVGELDYLKNPQVRKSIADAIANGKTYREVIKGVIDAAPDSIKSYMKKMIPEGLEEGAGSVGTDAYKEFLINGKVQYFNDTFDWKAISIDVLGGMMGGAIGNTMNRPNKTKDVEAANYMAALMADDLYKNAKNEKQLKQLKENLEGPKQDLQTLSTHTNWTAIDDYSKIRAFSLNQSIKGLQEQIEADKKSNIVDEGKVQKLSEMTEELNDILSAPEVAASESANHYNNTRDLIEALQSGDSDLSDIVSNPLWSRITEESRTKIEDISYNMRELKESMKKMDKRSPEYQSAQEQLNEGKKQIKELLNNTASYDSKNIPGVSSALGEGQEPVSAESQQRTSPGAPEAGGVLQAQKSPEQVIEDLTKAIEDDNKAIEETGDSILTPEARTDMERQLFEAKSEQAKATAAAEQQPVEQPVEGGAETPVGAVTTEPSTEEGAVAEEVQAEQKTDQQKEIERLEGLLAQDTQSQQQTGKGILASRPAVENRLASLKEEEKMTEKEDKRDEKESKREEKEYEDNKKSLKKVDPTMTERQADLATALFQQGMDAKKAIEEAKKKISLDERAAKMKEVSERVLSERKSRIAKEMGATAKSLQNFFKNAGMKVEFVKSSEDFERDYAESGATKTTEGMFIAKDGTIVFNKELLEDTWDKFGKNIMFHEAIHPVMNIIRNTDKKLYSSIVNGLKNEISRNADIKKAWEFANADHYKRQGEEIVEDEFIVESLAMIADGKLKLSTLPKQKRSFLVKALSKLGLKFGQKPLPENADDEALRKFAAKLHKSLTKGGLLEDVVGEENIKKYQKSILSPEAQELIVPGSQISGTSDISQKSIANSRIDDFDTTPPKVDGVQMKYPKQKESINQVLEKSGGAAVFVNSDGTKVGDVLINGKKYTIQGGLDYTFIKKNYDDGVGFAASEDQKISTLNNIAKQIAELRDKKDSTQKGKPVAVFVVCQNGEAMLGEWYAGEYIMEGVDKALNEGLYPGGVEAAKEDLINALNDLVITTKTEDGLKDNTARNKLLDMIKNGVKVYRKQYSFDTHECRMEIADFLSSKDVSFGFRSKLNGEIIASNEKLTNSGKNRRMKKALASAGHHMQDFWNKFADGRFLPGVEAEKSIPEKGKVFANKTFSGFYYDPFVPMQEQIKHTKKGISHRQFNSKFKSTGDPFLLTNAHNVNKLFPDMGYADTEGYEIYNKANKKDVGKKSSLEDRLAVSEWLNANGYNENVINPYSSVSLSIYTGYVTEEHKGQASQGGRTLPENISIVDGWYSPIEKKLRETNIDKQSAQKWLTSGMIGKGDEAIYTGVKGWLESKKPNDQVSKQEILDWMKDNRVEIKEVSLSNEPKMSRDQATKIFEDKGYDVIKDRNGDTYVEKDEELYDYNDMSPEEQDAWEVLVKDNLDSRLDKKAKYGEYQVEGEKSNYKEILVTLPGDNSLPTGYKVIPKSEYKDAVSTTSNFVVIDPNGYSVMGGDTEKDAVSSFLKLSSEGGGFKSPHFDEPNILVHLRMNTRTDVDGNKVLFLEELQSDWGQQGKKRGFKVDKKDIQPQLDKIDIELRNKYNIHTVTGGANYYRFEIYKDGKWIAVDESDNINVPDANARELITSFKELMGKLPPYSQANAPKAPYVTDTNAWTKLGLKMALREAVKQGVDRVAWTTGEQQNERYDLSKQVGSIIYDKNKDGTYNVSATRPEFRAVSPENSGANFIFNEYDVTPKRIEDVFGKDVAEKIINNEGEFEEVSGYRTLTGDNLKVGGKGMKGFYDNIVPNVATALVKELTGQRVEIGSTRIKSLARIPDNLSVADIWEAGGMDAYKEQTAIYLNQQSIDITPELKAAVQEGMPQFSEGGRVSNEGPLKEGLTADAGITDLDMSRWMKQNNVTSFSDNPEAVEKFKKDFNVTLSEQTLGQMSEKKAELPKPFKSLMKDVIDNIGNAYDSGMNIDTAIKQNLTSQPWYNSLSDQQKSDLDKVIDGVYGEQIEAQRQKEAEEQGTREPISDETKAKTQQLEELYQTILDGNNKEKKAAVEARDKILADDPKLKYIWKNYRNILKQLQSADNSKIELTKTEACP